MFRIGDFARLAQVSTRALRFYDRLDLLKPAVVDSFTDYRYYTIDQLPRLNRILALKDLGFSLEQIRRLLTEELSAGQLRGMLRLKRAEAEQQVREAQERLARVEARLRLIEQEDVMSNYEIVIKKVEPQWVASVRGIIPTYQDAGRLFNELYAYLGQLGAGGLSGAIWHDEEYKDRDVDAEVIAYLKSRVSESGRVKVYELPAATMASVVHNGAYNKFNQAYNALTKWIEANGYKIVGPSRELYLYSTQPVTQDNETYVSEIQFPVEKA